MALFSQAAVIGAGTMGRGIAQVIASAGLPVLLIDLNAESLQTAKARIARHAEKCLDKISTSTTLSGLSSCDLMIEAVHEDIALKRQIFAEADRLLPPEALLASNTSSLSISAIAKATKRPQSVLGLHFFNPPHVMRLLEIIRGAQTSDTSLQKAQLFAEMIGKTSITVVDSPGFATSRLGICLGLEAIRMVENKVASAQDIDRAMTLGYNHPIGPLQLTDLVGLDVRLAIAEHLFESLKSPVFEAPALLRAMVKEGRLGKKTGRGFYTWENDKAIS